MNKLSDDLLYLIFRSLDEDALHNRPARVCSRWRAVALAHPLLWINVTVVGAFQLSGIPGVLQRSGDTSIRLRMHDRVRNNSASSWDSRLFVDALATHAGRVEALDVTVASLPAFAELADQFLYCDNARLRSITARVQGEITGAYTFAPHAAAMLRHFECNFPFTAGAWLNNLTELFLGYWIQLFRLFDILRDARQLRILHTHVMRGPTTAVSLLGLSLRELACTGDTELDYNTLLALLGPATDIDRISIFCTLSYELVRAHLLHGLEPLTAMRIRNRRGITCWTCFTLADARGRRRHFSVPYDDPLVVSSALFGSGLLLRAIERLAVPVRDWRDMHGLLEGVHLARLHTVIFEVEITSGLTARGRPVILFDGPTSIGQPLQLKTPSLEEIALVFAKDRGGGRAAIEPIIALSYARQLVYDPSNPPILRLVNITLIREDGSDALADLQAAVESIIETSWHPGDSDRQDKWSNEPEYVFSWT